MYMVHSELIFMVSEIHFFFHYITPVVLAPFVEETVILLNSCTLLLTTNCLSHCYTALTSVTCASKLEIGIIEFQLLFSLIVLVNPGSLSFHMILRWPFNICKIPARIMIQTDLNLYVCLGIHAAFSTCCFHKLGMPLFRSCSAFPNNILWFSECKFHISFR